jgi:hypothetical protein
MPRRSQTRGDRLALVKPGAGRERLIEPVRAPPQVLALITATYRSPRRARALGWFAVTTGLAFVLGQILSGALVEAAGWRAIVRRWRAAHL